MAFGKLLSTGVFTCAMLRGIGTFRIETDRYMTLCTNSEGYVTFCAIVEGYGTLRAIGERCVTVLSSHMAWSVMPIGLEKVSF